MKDGAHDFLQKPVDSNHLLLLVERALEELRLRTENILLREEWSKRYGFPRIIGESEAIKRVVAETQRVAQTEATVLLLGESGTGKELFARAVHHLSKRRDKPFVEVSGRKGLGVKIDDYPGVLKSLFKLTNIRGALVTINSPEATKTMLANEVVQTAALVQTLKLRP